MPISRCNSAGFQLMLGVALMATSYATLSPSTGPLLFNHADKIIHAGSFLVLAFFADAGWPESDFHLKKYLPLFLYGVAIECLQYYIPSRSFSLLDMAANGAGLLIYGTLVFSLLKRWGIR